MFIIFLELANVSWRRWVGPHQPGQAGQVPRRRGRALQVQQVRQGPGRIARQDGGAGEAQLVRGATLVQVRNNCLENPQSEWNRFPSGWMDVM